MRQNTLQRRSVSLTQIWNEHQRELEREKERAASGKKTARSVPHGIEQEGPVVFPWRTLMYGSLVVLFNGACLFGAYLYFAVRTFVTCPTNQLCFFFHVNDEMLQCECSHVAVA